MCTFIYSTLSTKNEQPTIKTFMRFFSIRDFWSSFKVEAEIGKENRTVTQAGQSITLLVGLQATTNCPRVLGTGPAL